MIYPSQSNLILFRYYSLWHRYDIDPKDKISKYSWKYLQVDRENILLAVPLASSEESWLESRRIPNVQRLYTLRFLDITIIIKIFNHPSRWLFSLFLFLSLSSSSSLLLCSRLLKTDLSSTSVFTLWSSSEPEDSLHSPVK